MSKAPINPKKIQSIVSYVSHEKALESIEKALERLLLTDDNLTELTSRCNRLSSRLHSSESKDKLAHCYGQIDSFKVNNLVDNLFEKSDSLVRESQKLPQKELAIQIQRIQSETAQIWHNYALSSSNRRFMKIVDYNLRQLKASLSKTADTPFKDRLPQTDNRDDTDGFESAEFAFDLCEMAHDFYQNKINEGMKKLHQLTPSQKDRLEAICLACDADYPDQLNIEDIGKRLKAIMKFIQALVGFANEVVQDEPLIFYPSESEIHTMFQEVDNLKGA